MKKVLIAILLLALAACGCAALAEDQVEMRIISCPEQGFATLCRPEYDYSFIPDGGLTIELGTEIGDPYVSIFKTDAPGANFDSEYFLTNVYLQQVSDMADELVNVGEYTTYTLGGKDLPGIMITYRAGGESRFRFCAYDLEDDYFVQYEVACAAEDEIMEQALTALAVAIGNFQPEPNYYD